MARSFNGSSDNIILTSAIIGAAPLTIAVWFRADANASVGLVSIGSTAAWGFYSLELRSTGAIRAKYQDDGATAASAQTAATTSAATWNHACGTFASTSSRSVFLNGGNKITESTGLSTASSLDRSAIGGTYENGAFDTLFDGDLAEFGAWNVVLRDDEVGLLRRGVPPRLIRPQSLVSYVPMIGRISPEMDFKRRSWPVNGTAMVNHPRVSCRRSFPLWERAIATATAPPPSSGSSMFFASS